jgi:hypothetical protein
MLDDHRELDFDDQERALRRGQTGTSTFLQVPFRHGIPIPPLEVPTTPTGGF